MLSIPETSTAQESSSDDQVGPAPEPGIVDDALQRMRNRLATISSMSTGVVSGFLKKAKRFSVYIPGVTLEEEESKDDLKQDMSQITSQSEHSETRRRTREKVKRTMLRLKKECTLPTGVVGVHIKQLSLDNLDMYNLFQRFDATVYIRMSCQGQTKCTKAFADVVVPSLVCMDDLGHFRVQLNNQRSDPDNYLKFQIMAFSRNEPKIHKIISAKDIHLYDIVKKGCDMMEIPLLDSDRFQTVGELEVELVFTYGTFGYGYSSQFINQKRNPQEQVTNSMFYKVPPPQDREDFEEGIMSCKHVGHPSFIEFNRKSTVGVSSDYVQDILEYPSAERIEEPSLLVSKTRKHMNQLMREYRTQPDRIRRIQYLRNLVSSPGGHKEITSRSIEVSNNFALKRTITQSTQEKAAPTAEMTALKFLSPVLEMAGGISRRKEEEPPAHALRRRTQPEMSLLGRLLGRDIPMDVLQRRQAVGPTTAGIEPRVRPEEETVAEADPSSSVPPSNLDLLQASGSATSPERSVSAVRKLSNILTGGAPPTPVPPPELMQRRRTIYTYSDHDSDED